MRPGAPCLQDGLAPDARLRSTPSQPREVLIRRHPDLQVHRTCRHVWAPVSNLLDGPHVCVRLSQVDSTLPGATYFYLADGQGAHRSRVVGQVKLRAKSRDMIVPRRRSYGMAARPGHT
jgi:hypothetical protein